MEGRVGELRFKVCVVLEVRYRAPSNSCFGVNLHLSVSCGVGSKA
jgi:hypothetical protein